MEPLPQSSFITLPSTPKVPPHPFAGNLHCYPHLQVINELLFLFNLLFLEISCHYTMQISSFVPGFFYLAQWFWGIHDVSCI
jgi:hypothetical protein